MSNDLLTRIRFHCENGTSPYDDVMAFNAMLNRKAVRQPPEEVLSFLLSGLSAVIEGCSSWCVKHNVKEAKQQSSAPASSSSSDSEFDPVKTVLMSIAPLLKTWQNSALPAFIAACAATPPVESLPEAFQAVVFALSPPPTSASSSPQQRLYSPLLAAPLAIEVFHFTVKFAHESAAKALSCATLRRARTLAQIDGVEAFLAASDALIAQAPGNGAEAQSMALSAHTWLSQQLWERRTANTITAASTNIEASLQQAEREEAVWTRCVMQSLRLLARPSVSSPACPTEQQFRTALSTVEQARCLLLLAHGGVSRAVPVGVLFRRLATLGFSGAKPEFMLLTGFGLLSEAPATGSRDVAAKKLVAVYFTDRRSAPLAAHEGLKAVVDKFVAECFTQRSVAAASSSAAADKKGGGKVDVD